jgi:hypothetical protein
MAKHLGMIEGFNGGYCHSFYVLHDLGNVQYSHDLGIGAFL